MAKRNGNKQKRQTKDEYYMPTSEEEFQADLDAQDMRYLHYCREQEEMYNDHIWIGVEIDKRLNKLLTFTYKVWYNIGRE